MQGVSWRREVGYFHDGTRELLIFSCGKRDVRLSKLEFKFTAEISETETTFLDTKVYKGDRFLRESILDVRTHYKSTETFQYTNFYSCHPPGVTKGFIKGEPLRLPRTNSSQFTFEENMRNFKTRLQNRDYPARIVEKHLSKVKFSDRKAPLAQKNQTARKKILPFVTQYHPALPNLKDTLMGKRQIRIIGLAVCNRMPKTGRSDILSVNILSVFESHFYSAVSTSCDRGPQVSLLLLLTLWLLLLSK